MTLRAVGNTMRGRTPQGSGGCYVEIRRGAEIRK